MVEHLFSLKGLSMWIEQELLVFFIRYAFVHLLAMGLFR